MNIKIRLWDKISNRMIYESRDLENDDMVVMTLDGELQFASGLENYHRNDFIKMLYTGLKDNTKWNQLSQEEKERFYHQNCSEDGRTIKYQNIDDVKYLWEGKEIYEGDIYHLGDKNIKYLVVWHDTGLIGKQVGSSSYAGLEHWQDRIEVVGNIYENPELMEWRCKNVKRKEM
ncbi:YopX family protein [Wukongibacter sp. M2B1]|uniref:YopX family protein n=1 Tax=Wukongibacter sp. M2B1 TaxID=3088895 RepID=UPI003D7A6019